MKHKVKTKINSSTQQNRAPQLKQNPINLNKLKISPSQRQFIIEHKLANLLAQREIIINKLAPKQQRKLRQKISNQFN